LLVHLAARRPEGQGLGEPLYFFFQGFDLMYSC
jgi:hypothetical protein